MFNLYAPNLENPIPCVTLEEAMEKAKELYNYDDKWRFNGRGQSWKTKVHGLCILYENENETGK